MRRVTGPNGQSAVSTSTGTKLTVVQAGTKSTGASAATISSVTSLILTAAATLIALVFIIKGLGKNASDLDHFAALALLALVVLWADKSQMIQQFAQLGSYAMAELQKIGEGE